jgi:NO-binding membrane sensor protein with MHYT domain
MNPSAVMLCHHDLRLVALSIIISILAAFAARELVGRINEARGQLWLGWLARFPVFGSRDLDANLEP